MTIEKREGELKSQFTAELKRQLPHFLSLLFASAGAPDRAIVGAGVTSMWEFKHGTPDFASPGDQELTCMRLAVQGHCRYVVFQENKFGQCKRTMILHPRQVYQRSGWAFVPEDFCLGFDVKWLVEQVRKVHHA